MRKLGAAAKSVVFAAAVNYFFNIIFSFLNIKPISNTKRPVKTKFESIASTTPRAEAVVESTADIDIPLPINGIA